MDKRKIFELHKNKCIYTIIYFSFFDNNDINYK